VLGIINREDASYYKEFDEKGNLVSLVELKDPASCLFDSLVYAQTLVKVIAAGCPAPGAPCYEVHRMSLKPALYGLEKEIEYYQNNMNYKTIGIYRRLSQRDTIVTLLNDTDSLSHPWQLHKSISVTPLGIQSKHDSNLNLQSIHYTVPALGISFDRWEFPGMQRFPLPVIDSVAGMLRFTDTVQIGKSASQVLHLNMYKKAPDIAGQGLFSLRTEQVSDLFIAPSMNAINLLLGIGSGTTNEEAHQLLVNKQPYNGRVAYAHKSKPAFAKKDSVLLLASESIFEYAIFFKGSYRNGYQHGDWEVTDVCKERCRSPREHFDRQKKNGRYLHGSYARGLRNGAFEEYALFTPRDEWEKKTYGTQAIRYLSKRLTYVNDTLHGPALENQTGGQPMMSCNYDKGQLDGEYILYGDYGKTQVAHYSAGKPDGPFREYFDDKNQSLQTSAEFRNGKLQGLLEQYGKRKWLEIRADSGYLDYKKLFYDEGPLKEEIVLDDKRACQLADYHTTGEVFMTYALLPHGLNERSSLVRKHRVSAADLVDADSANIAHFTGNYKSYFLSGQLYCEGRIVGMKPVGTWNFYNESGTLIHRVDFRDSVIVVGNDSIITLGKLTGYYYTKALRCEAFVTAVDVHYDCNTQKDLSAFEMAIRNNYDFQGKENCINGSGPVRQYSENGLLQASGQMLNFEKTGLWKYYDPDQKLNAMGYYAANKKDGVWCEGDLEGINYEDAACFDPNDKNAKAQFEYSKKELRIRKTIYKNGEALAEEVYEADMNR